MIDLQVFKRFPELNDMYEKDSENWYAYMIKGKKLSYFILNKDQDIWVVKKRDEIFGNPEFSKFKIDNILFQKFDKPFEKKTVREELLKEYINKRKGNTMNTALLSAIKDEGLDEDENGDVVIEGPVYTNLEGKGVALGKQKGKLYYSACIGRGDIYISFKNKNEENNFFEMDSDLEKKVDQNFRFMYS